jgi:hypothetical protein
MFPVHRNFITNRQFVITARQQCSTFPKSVYGKSPALDLQLFSRLTDLSAGDFGPNG